jgi:triacylglycerol lipase
MGWLANCSESERASILANLAGRAYLSEAELKATEKTLKMQRSKAKFIKDGDAEAWVFITRDDAIIVSCRGTEPTQFRDILADLKTIPVRHPRAGRVHQGFKEYTDLVFDEIIAHVKKMRKKEENVFVVGHSLGGAMAVLVAEGLSDAGVPVKELRTFGQPRVGNRAFRRHLEGCDIGRYIRYVNNNDIVTSVPPSAFGFVHGGNLHYINYHGNIRNFTAWQRVKDGWRGFWAACKQFKFFDFVADHGMPNYVEKAGNIAKLDK